MQKYSQTQLKFINAQLQYGQLLAVDREQLEKIFKDLQALLKEIGATNYGNVREIATQLEQQINSLLPEMPSVPAEDVRTAKKVIDTPVGSLVLNGNNPLLDMLQFKNTFKNGGRPKGS